MHELGIVIPTLLNPPPQEELRGFVKIGISNGGGSPLFLDDLADLMRKYSGGPDPADLRRWLLYWDKMDMPETENYRFHPSPEMEFLMSIGIMERTVLPPLYAESMDEADAVIQFAALERRERMQPGSWALAQPSKFIVAPRNAISNRSIEIELYNALPSATKDTPLEDILRFKEKRQSELLALRIEMVRLYQEISSSGDPARAMLACKTRVDAAISDWNQVFSETFVKRLMASCKIEYMLASSFAGVAVGMTAATYFDLPLTTGGLVGGFVSGIKFSPGSLKRAQKIKDDSKPFAYLHGIATELGSG